MSTDIHPTAIVEEGVELDDGVAIGPYSIVRKGVRLGRNSRVQAHVVIEGDTTLGENCSVFPFASIGLPPQDLKYHDEPTRLTIGANNIFREYVTVHRASVGGDGQTTIGDNNFLMAYSHVAHDCRVGSNVTMANAATLGGHVVVEDYVVIGGLAAAHQFTRIGRLAMVSGLTGVVQDIPPYTIASGARARLFGLNAIGLKRLGMDDEQLADLKRAYKILFREKQTLREALKRVQEELPYSDEIAHMVEFLKASKRGICR